MADAPSLESFADSPLWVDAPAQRERWWFADGTWVDQGPIGAPVSHSLTHWCADRGLAGGPYDQAYALALHQDLNRADGREPDTEEGESIPTAVRVMQERGLVGAAYECAGREAVSGALLARGPLLAGISWYRSFGEPELVDGTFVARGPGDAEVLGGHCVLLDGIALDLQLGGVTGFARFKNVWGRAWGDEGHCLIGLDDLIEHLSSATLLIPAADRLRSGVSPDVATPGERPASLTPPESFGQQSIGSDRWTLVDTLGYAAHADAIARAICHRHTEPPLTIGIKAPWGAGKTSLMRMVQDRLEWPAGHDGDPGDPRAIHLLDSTRAPVTNGDVLAAVSGAPADGRDVATPELSADHAAEEDRRWRPTVWFNPWMYQSGEEVLAGLAHEIITQTTRRMPPVEQEHFWLRLNRARIDEQAVRRRIYGLVVSRVIPWAAGGLAVLVAGLIALAAGAPASIGAAVAALGPVATATAAVATLQSVLKERTRGTLSAALGPNAYEELVRAPDYEKRSGALYLVREDLQRVFDLVASRERPLIVFVDDLDRCNPGTVVKVIEAINLFVAGEFAHTVFVVALDPGIVAAHIETAYGDLAKRLAASERQTFDLGWRFLEKIVQLPLSLPTVGPTRARSFVGGFFAGQPEAPAGPAPAPEETEVRVAETRLTADRVVGASAPEAVKEAERR